MSKATSFVPLRVARMSISDRHTMDTDNTGQWLDQAFEQSGHALVERCIIANNRYQIRARLSAWIASANVEVIITHGGTGFAVGNCTEQAIKPLLDKSIDGFGEIFRQLSFHQIGSSALQSQAFAGLVNGSAVFAIPGSQGAAQLAWQQLIQPQLDARQGPCNFVAHLQRGQCDG